MTNLLDIRWVLLILLIAIFWLMSALQAVLMPFFVGALLGYMGDPIVDRLELKGLSRTAGVSIVFLVLAVIGLLSLMVLIPMLIKQISYLHSKVPVMLDWLSREMIPWVGAKLGSVGVDSALLSREQLEAQLKESATQMNWGATGDLLKPILTKISQSGLAFIAFVGNLALIPVVGFYLIRDWDLIVAKLRQLLPRGVEPTVVRLVGECDEVLAAFLKGQLLVMVALGVIYTVGLWAVGLELALLIGMLAGLGSIVPYLGFTIGIVAALIASFFQFGDWLHPGLVVVVFIIGQMLEGMVLTPILVGDRIGLHPVAVIFAVLAGAQLFGFVGMLLALPVAAVIVVLLRHVHEIYLASQFYEGATPLGEALPQGTHGRGSSALSSGDNQESEQKIVANPLKDGKVGDGAIDGEPSSDQ